MAYETFFDPTTRALELMKVPNDSALCAMTIANVPIDEREFRSPRFDETGGSFKSGVIRKDVLVELGDNHSGPHSIAHEGREIVNNLTPHKDNARSTRAPVPCRAGSL
jgi:L-asparagine oxygenase